MKGESEGAWMLFILNLRGKNVALKVSVLDINRVGVSHKMLLIEERVDERREWEFVNGGLNLPASSWGATHFMDHFLLSSGPRTVWRTFGAMLCDGNQDKRYKQRGIHGSLKASVPNKSYKKTETGREAVRI